MANVDNFTGIHKRKAETRQNTSSRNSGSNEQFVDELTLPIKSALKEVDVMVLDPTKSDKIAQISKEKEKDATPQSPSFTRMTASQQHRIAQETLERESKRESLGSESGRFAPFGKSKDKRLSGSRDDDIANAFKPGRQMAWESVTGEKENKGKKAYSPTLHF